MSPGGWAIKFWGTTGCPHSNRELEGTLKLHEFMREAEALQGWLSSQKEEARGGESLGEDYEHVLVRGGLGQGGSPGAGCWGLGWLERGPWVLSPG